MPGAAALCANATIKAGAGLVELITPSVHSSVLPEVLTRKIDTKGGCFTKENLDEVLELIDKCNVIAIGPGIGNDERSIEFIADLYRQIPENKTKILDADALRIMDIEKVFEPNTIITPHFVEFSRITKTAVKDVLDSPLEKAIEAAKKMQCIVLLKHVPTIITDGEETFFNINGNPGMASGGSGDVLTGIISGLAAQKIDLLKAAATGALWHSLAGDHYQNNYGQLTLTASELIDNLKNV
jgi:NAD(P)H-hydrate epimerase